MTREMLAAWLAETCTHGELAAGVARLFSERGPALPRRLRRDLKLFLDDRSARVLAECLAMSRRIADEAGFIEWCREVAADGDDPCVRCGVRRRDFCADRGPGGPDAH